MNIASLFLTLGIKGDTKSLDDAIKKVEELKKQTQELNKALKETKSNSKISVSTGAAASGAKTLKESQVLREEAAVSAAKLRIAKTELGFVNLEEQAKKKQEREQKKREKDREKATKDFFSQIENGFSFVAKAFTGGLLAGGIGGYITSQASRQVALSASLKQYGIDPETSQRYANVFRQASGGQVGVEETNAFIANISEQIAQGLTTNPEILSKFAILGIDPRNVVDFKSALEEIRGASKNPNYNQANLTSLLSQLGVPREFAPAFGKGFSDAEFEDAYKNAKILTNEQVEAARKVNIELAQLKNSLSVLSGVLLEEFAPAIIGISNKIKENLTSENIKDAGEIAKGLGAGYLFTKGAKTIAKYGKAGLGRLGVAGAGGLALYEGLSYLAEKNEQLLNGGKKSKKSFVNEEDKEYVIPSLGTQTASGFVDRDPNGRLSEDDLKSAALVIEGEKQSIARNSANNITTNVTINADSVDANTAPFIADKISRNVDKTILLNSKYPTMSVPK